jgi:hypothetical protein
MSGDIQDERLTHLELRTMELEVANEALSQTLLHLERLCENMEQRIARLERQHTMADPPGTG